MGNDSENFQRAMYKETITIQQKGVDFYLSIISDIIFKILEFPAFPLAAFYQSFPGYKNLET